MSRRWRLGLVLALLAGLAGLSCHQYLQLQAALPPTLQADARLAEYQAVRRLAGELARPLRQPGVQNDDVLAFRARQETLAVLRSYALNTPFRSELLLVADTPAWTEAWQGGPQARRVHDGLSGPATWILPVNNGQRWSLQVRRLEDAAPTPDTLALNRHLLGLVASSAALALVLGISWGWRLGRARRERLPSAAQPVWDQMRTDLGALDEAVSDHMRLRGELARQSEELAAVTEAVRLRREQRRREGQPA
ncbi:hypothetical protein H5407_12050 [Mitsuaria sp. WAJ17]|uniref:hypothetical protein n=1 Tax=Mitsuaria sp. WAJ17 TaxID=2761452 RepID=UPI001600B399|nr:hypothetical protein [Mitsuaria sp. WAJ17]MBB2485953.1 hypothetical protein [Mitsuaria sp. WAJ17]